MKNFPQQLAHANGAPMVLDNTRLLVAFKRAPGKEELDRLLSQLDLSLEDSIIDKAVPGEIINHTSQRFWLQARRALNQERFEAIEKTALAAGAEFLSPVYRLTSERGRRALLSPLASTILVRPRQRQDIADADLGRSVIAATQGGAQAQIEEITEKSRYLNGYRYLSIKNPGEVNAYELYTQLAASKLVADVQYETMPLVVPTAVNPSDSLLAQQWDMARIGAAGAGQTGWDLSTGNNVVVCVLDTGCDMGHPDLVFSGTGINLGSMSGDGSPTGNHGTACAGIVAGVFNNALGVAGVAGTARILPVAFQNWTDAEVASGITWATANGAAVISMSFGSNAWSHMVIDPAILAAFNANVLMCAATHNYNGPITYPATNANIMAIGASDEIDNRKTPLSPDMETWGSDFGPEISVVAPGVHIPSTDRRGSAGYNTNSGAAGDYTLTFNGTSSATPHVAGLAALIRSFYPLLTNVQVRGLIERSAQKVGTVAYAETAGKPNGSWNQEMGYGRINVFQALDAADVMIKDAPSDSGSEPFTGGNFWDFSDIVVRINDDNVFVPSDPLQSKNVERGQANTIYVRITNNGPRDARNVTVSTRITPYVGLQFMYPYDWNTVDGMHVSPTALVSTFASIPSGTSVMAKFRIEAPQTETLYGWVANNPWHPCLLASVNADNDYAFGGAVFNVDPVSARRNNLAQRNLSVIDVLSNASANFPFVMGHRLNTERTMTLKIDRSRLPADMPLMLSIDDDGGAFPAVNFTPDGNKLPGDNNGMCGDRSLTFLDTTRVKTTFGCCEGVLTLEKGSLFECAASSKPGKVTVVGGDVIVRNDKRYVEIRNSQVTVQIEKAPGAIYPMSLQSKIPATAQAGEQFLVQAAQADAQGQTVGGAAMCWVVG